MVMATAPVVETPEETLPIPIHRTEHTVPITQTTTTPAIVLTQPETLRGATPEEVSAADLQPAEVCAEAAEAVAVTKSKLNTI